jgi:hypothetical protein
MPPVDRFVPRFAAEPPQGGLPYGRWAERLGQEFLAACLSLDDEPEDLGRPGNIVWYPDRSWHGHTYVPATSLTSTGYELFGFVRFLAAGEEEPSDFQASVDFTDQTAERNPEWRLDICDEVIGAWRGGGGELAAMTLIWGRPLIAGGRVATAELAGLAVDQCELIEERFTLIAPDDYSGDLLEIKLWSTRGKELARESLYEGDEQEEEEEEEEEEQEEEQQQQGQQEDGGGDGLGGETGEAGAQGERPVE